MTFSVWADTTALVHLETRVRWVRAVERGEGVHVESSAA